MLAADVSTLEEAVQACKQCGLTNDDPEFKGGRNRLEFLQCKKGNDSHVFVMIFCKTK